MAPNRFLDHQLGALRAAGYRPRAVARFATELWRRSQATAAERPDLRRELLLITAVGMVPAILAGVAMVAEGVNPVLALLAPAVAWLVLCAWVRVELGLVRHPITDEPSPAIGPANVLSLYRGWASVPLLVIGVSRPGPTLMAIALAASAAVTDLVDGSIAMRLHQESRLGRLLDPMLDAVLFSVVAVDLSLWGLLPWWVAVLVAVRYFAVVIGGLVLLFAMGRSLPVRHTPWGQRSTLAIGISLGLTLISRFVAIPAPVLLAVYFLTVVTMVLALLGIARRVPSADAGALA